MKLKHIGAAFGAIFLLSAPAQAAVNLITNGDFESGVNGGRPAGWNDTVAPNGEIAVFTGAQYQPCCGVTGNAASLANSFASFGAGDAPTNGAYLAQTFNTVAGATYNVSFDFGALGSGGPLQLGFFAANTATFSIEAFSNYNASANNNLDATFTRYNTSFTASGSFSSIAFNVTGPTASIDGILDNVTVTGGVAGGVPEPSTWAMMLLGFAGLAFAAGRKQTSGGAALTAA